VRTRVSASVDQGKPAARQSELVFIGYHLRRAQVAAMLSDLSGTPWK
jgi:cobalamin biosynthesis protein CobW